MDLMLTTTPAPLEPIDIRIDRKINDLENRLSYISAYPVIGTPFGAIKILFGASQSIIAATVTIFSLIPAAATKKWSLTKYSWTHVKHGIGNIIAGVIESIPIVQTLSYKIRRIGYLGSDVAHLVTRHEDKYMPYTSLEERDWLFYEPIDPVHPGDSLDSSWTTYADTLEKARSYFSQLTF